MAIPAGVSRIVFSGAMPNGEIWSTGFWIQGDTPTTDSEANALAELAFDEFSASDSSGAMRVTIENLGTAQQIWNEVKTYCYPTGGPTATVIGSFTLPSPVVGEGTVPGPNQLSTVLTLRTALAGRAHRGRMYLPAMGIPMASDGQLSQAVMDLVVGAWKLGFSDWNAASTGKIVVVSTSQKGNEAYPGAATLVTQVTMDSRMDIQRSRANSETILRGSSATLTS